MAGIRSIRFRLTVWYTTVVALALVIMALATYSLLQRIAADRATRSLFDTAQAVMSTTEPRIGALEEAVTRFRAPDRRLLLYSPDGRLLAQSQPLAFRRLVAEEVFAVAPDDSALLEASRSRRRVGAIVQPAGLDVPVRVISFPRQGGPRASAPLEAARERRRGRRPEATRDTSTARMQRFQQRGGIPRLVIIGSTRDQQFIVENARAALIAACVITLLIAALPGYYLARRTLAPISLMTKQAARIGAANLDERIPVANPRDELGELATVFNDLLNRLQGAFQRQREFMASAAHELRTPVAVVRAEAELALARKERATGEYRDALNVVEHESLRMTRIVDDLLTLSRAESGQYPLHPLPLDLRNVIQQTVRTLRLPVEQAEATIDLDFPTALPFTGDAVLLQRVFSNLIENALRHTAPGTRVEISAKRVADSYHIQVRDHGRGIPESAVSRIFEPFYRADQARAAGEQSGAGLGLPIARWSARAHGGDVSLVSTGSAGTTFEVTLPAE